MDALVRWTNEALAVNEHHPILVLGVFVVRFLAIHPFQDGNGRLARVLTTLLLLRAGYDYVPYASLERVIEANKDEYYRTLRRAQATLDCGETGLADWMRFFARALAEQKRVLGVKVERENLMDEVGLAKLDAEILRLVREHGQLTLANAVKLTGANRNTLKAHLRDLVAESRLALRGRGRGSWYEGA
jgi:Fic family protein